jgi:methylmalonyl-CoA mutase C-terminal domain/subunit
MSGRIRVLLAKPTQDCHDRGVRYLATKFRDAGFEVIFSNFLLPAEIVNTAVQEDVNVIGISSSSGGHMPTFIEVIAGMKERGLSDRLLIGGGVIPEEDREILQRMGVMAIFGPGASAEDAVAFIRRWSEA